MNQRQAILEKALEQMVIKINGVIKSYGYSGEPIRMILAGGMAINYYCGTRYTSDVDATFSRKLLLPYEDLVVHYVDEAGKPAYIYFDTNYSPSLALMHENYEDDVIPYTAINQKDRHLQLFLLSPIDLAISKIARFSSQDVEDILALAKLDYFTAQALEDRAMEAISYYIGNVDAVKTSIHLICQKIDALEISHSPA